VANQAIALQARAPQANPLGGAIQQNAQLINMMSQQRAAERQAAAAQQQMQIAGAKEQRDATAAEIDLAGKKIDFYTKRAGQTMTPEGYAVLLKDLDKDAPEIAAAFRANLPEANFNRDALLRMVGSIGDNFKATYGPLETEVVQMEDGTYSVARTGGFGKPGVFELEEFQLAPGGAAPAQTPNAPAAVKNAFPTTAAPATAAQIDDAARKIIRGAGVGELGISADDFDRASERANQMKAGGGASMQPVSMTTGPQTGAQPDLAAVVQDMMSSGQISQANLQLMRDTAGPANDAQLAEILRTNNIRIVPEGEPSMRSAVFRPGEDAAPQMQQVQDMGDYRATGRPARGKSPMQSPLPGSAQVPITRVREEAVAGRESPQEAAAKAAAVARANAAAEAEAKRAQKQPGQKNVSTIIGKMRSAYKQLDKMEAIPSEARGGGANFMDYLAVTRGGREVQKMFGTETSKYLSQIETLRKQLATAIKNATGMSAQEMNSNVELQLTLDSLSDPTQGIEAALTTMADLEELYGLPKPAAGKPKTTTGQRKALGDILGGR
jgi:hypothetical protein